MLKVWWSTGPSNGNFGDVLTPHIFNHFGIEHCWSDTFDAISTGSIIRFAIDGTHVLGSGALDSSDRINPAARFHWVRGPLTGEKVRKSGGECPEVYGDPAMLLPQVFPRTVEADREVGVFAHYNDLGYCGERYPVVINPLAPPQDVLRSLWRCKRVVSSSLHGIIAAHAYGIPAAWARFSTQLAGDGIKFHDHARSVGLAEMPLSTVEEPDFTLPVRVDNIASVLNAFSERLRTAQRR